MIKKFDAGLVVYIFEVEREEYTAPPTWVGISVIQRCYFPIPGSLAYYRKGFDMCLVDSETADMWFPADDCRYPSKEELYEYNSLPLI